MGLGLVLVSNGSALVPDGPVLFQGSGSASPHPPGHRASGWHWDPSCFWKWFRYLGAGLGLVTGTRHTFVPGAFQDTRWDSCEGSGSYLVREFPSLGAFEEFRVGWVVSDPRSIQTGKGTEVNNFLGALKAANPAVSAQGMALSSKKTPLKQTRSDC